MRARVNDRRWINEAIVSGPCSQAPISEMEEATRCQKKKAVIHTMLTIADFLSVSSWRHKSANLMDLACAIRNASRSFSASAVTFNAAAQEGVRSPPAAATSSDYRPVYAQNRALIIQVSAVVGHGCW